jgi:ribosomal protein S18 acetylase RimI-like enzyme
MNIRKMVLDDLDEVINVIAKAFIDKPLYKYFTEDEKERENFLHSIFKFRISSNFNTKIIDVAVEGKKIIGVASWDFHDLNEKPNPNATKNIENALSTCSEATRKHWFAFLTTLTGSIKEIANPPFWALSPIAVLPEEQGKGVGNALIKKKLAEIDKSPYPCFLATQESSNLKIYSKYGFKIIKEDMLLPNLPSYNMLRQCNEPKI